MKKNRVLTYSLELFAEKSGTLFDKPNRGSPRHFLRGGKKKRSKKARRFPEGETGAEKKEKYFLRGGTICSTRGKSIIRRRRCWTIIARWRRGGKNTEIDSVCSG